MSDQALSALLDGECSDAELDRLLREMDDAPELAQRWTQLCLNRDLREGVRVAPQQRCIASSVMAQIEALPEEAGRSSKVVPMATWRRRMAQIKLKPLVGFAAAASMGGAAVMLMSSLQQPQGSVPMAGVPADVAAVQSSAPSANDALAGATVANASLQQAAPVNGSSTPQWPTSTFDDAQPAQRWRTSEQLQAYLMDHSNSIGDQGVGGTLRYARFAAHTADYRAADEPR